jgi:hypothetical protein
MSEKLDDSLLVEMKDVDPPAAAAAPLARTTSSVVQGKLPGNCIQCGVGMGNFLGTMTEDGPLHNECVPMYQKKLIERCAHCDCVLRNQRMIVTGKKLHPECVSDFKAKKPFVPPMKQMMLKKFAIGRSTFGRKNWKDRYFVLSKETQLSYYESMESFRSGASPKGKVALDGADAKLISKPTRMHHPEALNPSKELVICFSEGGKALKLLIATTSWADHEEWARALEFYIKNVDDPKDYLDPVIVATKKK